MNWLIILNMKKTYSKRFSKTIGVAKIQTMKNLNGDNCIYGSAFENTYHMIGDTVKKRKAMIANLRSLIKALEA